MENPVFIVACGASDNLFDTRGAAPRTAIKPLIRREALWTGRRRGFISRPRRRPDGRVAMQRTANPRTPVRFRVRPPLMQSAVKQGIFLVSQRFLKRQ